MSKVSEHKEELAECVNFWRESTYKCVWEQMIDFFENLGRVLYLIEEEELMALVFDKPVSGIPASLMETAKERFFTGKTREWMDEAGNGERAEMLMAFLNFDQLKMDNFKCRYPNAFHKWTEKDDAALLSAYNSFPGKIRWS